MIGKKVMILFFSLFCISSIAFGGLVGEWNFNEGSGNIVNDSSGNNNQGLIHGAIWTTGKLDGGMQFDGIDDYIEISDSDSLDTISSALTLIAWIKPNLDSTRGSIIARFLYDYDIPINERVFELDLGEDYLINFSISADGTNEKEKNVWLNSYYTVKDNEWIHLAATSDGTNMKIYLNGEEDPKVINAPAGIHISSQGLQIGAWEYSPGKRDNYFKGIIDEVKIYNEALSSGEIIDDFLAGAIVGSIHGKVTDKSTGESLPYAKVITYLKSAITNEKGEYTLTNIQTGNYSVRAFKGGYQGSKLIDVEVHEDTPQIVDFELEEATFGDVILWDTTKAYTQKNPFSSAFADRENWVQVPYGITDYTWIGDPMIENKYYYLFLFSNEEDSPCLAAKLNNERYSQNEIYKVHDTGYRNFGMGRMWTEIIENTTEEIIVKSAEKGKRFGPPGIPIVNTYRIINKPWLEVKPVENMNQQGMHAKSRLAAFVYTNVKKDVILDGKKHEEFEENVYPSISCIGEINFHRSVSIPSGEDFMWFLTFPEGAETNELTYQGIHYPDPFWEWDDKPAAPSVGANYAYLEEKVIIGVLNFGDNWKREDVKQDISIGETYVSSFTATYSGRWRVCGSIDDDWNVTDFFNEVDVNVGDRFTFLSPVNGTLDYLVMYMWDRTSNTPEDIFTPMDVYRKAILGIEEDTTPPGDSGDTGTIDQNKQDKILVLPNPYIKGESSIERISFGNLPKEVTIRIYTISGKLVKTIKHKSSADGGNKVWDISEIASGVYIYSIISPSGNKDGKIAIIK